MIVEGLSTIAERTSRAGWRKAVNRPAITRSDGRSAGGELPRTIDDQQLMLDEKRLGDDGARPARL